MKSVATIVVTFNRLRLLQEEVEALRNQSFGDHQIIVVNNGSTDDTLEWLNEQEDVITITQENLGGAGGFYTGMKYAVEHNYKYCWIMDDDVICSPDALEQLFKSFHAKKNIGFVCSNVFGVDGRPMNVPTVAQKEMDNGYPDFMDMIDKSMIRVSCATFVSVFLPTAVISAVGLPYKEYFIWGDDTEYTERISAEYPCYVSGLSKVVHKRSLQKGLDFLQETNPVRLNFYFYKIRNSGHRLKLKGMSLKRFYYDNIKLIVNLSFKRKWKHVGIVTKALIAVKGFNPKVIFAKALQT